MNNTTDMTNSRSVFFRYGSFLQKRPVNLRGYRPTYFSPTNCRWVSAPSLAHYNRGLELEFGNVDQYELANYRVCVAAERGLAKGVLDCWVARGKTEWVETFATGGDPEINESPRTERLCATEVVRRARSLS